MEKVFTLERCMEVCWKKEYSGGDVWRSDGKNVYSGEISDGLRLLLFN